MLILLRAAAEEVVTPANLWRQWPLVQVPTLLIVVTAIVYGRGVRRLWKSAGRGHGITVARVVSFYAGMVTLLLALASPLDALADTLFSAHMLQHVLLIAVAAPLVVLGVPAVPLLWGFSRDVRVAIGRNWTRSRLGAVIHPLLTPVPAWLLHTVALWVWHLPGPYAAALSNEWIHAAEHTCFFVTALMVWWVAFSPAAEHRGETLGPLAVLLGTFIQSGALGALLTFASTPWYYGQSVGAGVWHLTALEDQQLAGLIMWIPASFIYIGAILAVMLRWFRDEPGTLPTSGIAVARGYADDRS